MNLYAKYLSRAESAFARRDARRCPPDPQARFLLSLLTGALNRLSANDARDWERDERAAMLRRERRTEGQS